MVDIDQKVSASTPDVSGHRSRIPQSAPTNQRRVTERQGSEAVEGRGTASVALPPMWTESPPCNRAIHQRDTRRWIHLDD